MRAMGLSLVLACGKPVENPHPPVESLWIVWGKVLEKIRIKFVAKKYLRSLSKCIKNYLKVSA